MANGNYTAYELAELQENLSNTFRTAIQGQKESDIATGIAKKDLTSQLLEDVEEENIKTQKLLDKERDTGFFGKLFDNPIGNIIASINPVLGGIKAVSGIANKLKDQQFEEKKLKRILDNLQGTTKYKGTSLEKLYKQDISKIKDFVQDKYDIVSDIEPLSIIKDAIPEFLKDKALGETTGNIIQELDMRGFAKQLSGLETDSPEFLKIIEKIGDKDFIPEDVFDTEDRTLLEGIMSGFGGDDKENEKAFLKYLQSILR